MVPDGLWPPQDPPVASRPSKVGQDQIFFQCRDYTREIYNVPLEPERAAEAREARRSCEYTKNLFEYRVELLTRPCPSAQLSGFAAQAAADANSRHHPAYLPSDVRSPVSPAFTLPSRRDDGTTTGRTASREGTDRSPSELQLHKTQKQYPQAGMQGATANQGAYR